MSWYPGLDYYMPKTGTDLHLIKKWNIMLSENKSVSELKFYSTL